jgi:hypothetical protein
MDIIAFWNVTPFNLAEWLFHLKDPYFCEALINLYQASLCRSPDNSHPGESYLQRVLLLASEALWAVCVEDNEGQIPFTPLNTKMSI